MRYSFLINNEKYKLTITYSKDRIWVLLHKKSWFLWTLCDMFEIDFLRFTDIEFDIKNLLKSIYKSFDTNEVFNKPISDRGKYIESMVNNIEKTMEELK